MTNIDHVEKVPTNARKKKVITYSIRSLLDYFLSLLQSRSDPSFEEGPKKKRNRAKTYPWEGTNDIINRKVKSEKQKQDDFMHTDVDITLCDSYWSPSCILLIWDGYGLVRAKNIKSSLSLGLDRRGFRNIIVGTHTETSLKLNIYVSNTANILAL